MNNTIVIAHPILPNQIDTNRAFMGGFDKCESEDSARWLVWMRQETGNNWNPFTLDEINKFVIAKASDAGKGYQFEFGDLIDDEYIFKHKGLHYFTHEFITKAFLVSPQVVEKYKLPVTPRKKSA